MLVRVLSILIGVERACSPRRRDGVEIEPQNRLGLPKRRVTASYCREQLKFRFIFP